MFWARPTGATLAKGAPLTKMHIFWGMRGRRESKMSESTPTNKFADRWDSGTYTGVRVSFVL